MEVSLAQVAEELGMNFVGPGKQGGDSWGKGKGWIQGSAKIEEGFVTQVRISNTRTANWHDEFQDGVVRYHLPATDYNRGVTPEHRACFAQSARSGKPITFRISIFPPGNGVSKDYWMAAKLDAGWNGQGSYITISRW